jgi:hypothetical protein
MRKSLLRFRFAMVVLLSAFQVQAQVDRATLTGTVLDSSGAALISAKVTAVHRESGLQRVVSVQHAGNYVLHQLPIGTWDVTIEAPGFWGVRHENVVLQVGQIRTLDVSLEIAPAATQVDVVGTAGSIALQPSLDPSFSRVRFNNSP